MNGDAVFVTGYEIISKKSYILQDGVRDYFSLNAQFILGKETRKTAVSAWTSIRFLRLKIDRYTLSFVVPYLKLSKTCSEFCLIGI